MVSTDIQSVIFFLDFIMIYTAIALIKLSKVFNIASCLV